MSNFLLLGDPSQLLKIELVHYLQRSLQGCGKWSYWPFKSAVTPVWVTEGSRGVGLSHETVSRRRESSKSVHSQRREDCGAAAEMEIWLNGLLKNGYVFHTQGKREKKYVLPVNWILEEVRASGTDCEHHILSVRYIDSLSVQISARAQHTARAHRKLTRIWNICDVPIDLYSLYVFWV